VGCREVASVRKFLVLHVRVLVEDDRVPVLARERT
jgi:hypothetical protein